VKLNQKGQYESAEQTGIVRKSLDKKHFEKERGSRAILSMEGTTGGVLRIFKTRKGKKSYGKG